MGCPNCGRGWWNALCKTCAGEAQSGGALTTARKIALAVSIFDCTTPTVKGLQIVANDPTIGLDTWTFFLDYDLAIKRGWSLAHIQDLLEKHGVQYLWRSVQSVLRRPFRGTHRPGRLGGVHPE